MAQNLFGGFSEYLEAYAGIVKHQLGVGGAALRAMPVSVPANSRLGKIKIDKPTVFYVDDADENSVTLSNVPPDSITFGDAEDEDGDIDREPGTPRQRVSVVISKDEFAKLVEPPPGPPGGMPPF